MTLAMRLTAFALLATVLVGCGRTDFGPLGSVSGKLTKDGQPQPAGSTVIFMHPIDGHAGFGLTNEAGEYKIEWRKEHRMFDGLPVGKYQVMIVPADGIDVDDLSADEMLAGGANVKVGNKSSIPAKYRRAASSGLEYDIVEGENSIDIDLSSR